jgi:hypothetical protein
MFRTISIGPLLPIQVPYAKTYSSTTMKKTYLDSMSERQCSHHFTFATTSASVVPGVMAITVPLRHGCMT